MSHNTQIAAVDFHGHALTVITEKGQHLVAMKPICESIGLTWHGQLERIKRDEVLQSTIRVMRMVAEDGKQREITCLPLDMLNGWLFGIEVKRCRIEVQPALILFKRECYAALAAYWQHGAAINPRQHQPKALPNGLNTEQQGVIKALVRARVEALPEGRRAKAAITCWSALKSKFGCTYKAIEPAQFTEALSLVARLPLEGEWLGAPAAPTGNQLSDQDLYIMWFALHHFSKIHALIRSTGMLDHLDGLGSPLAAGLRDHLVAGGNAANTMLTNHAAEFDNVQRRLRLNQYRD